MIHERKIFDLSMIGTSDLGISEEHATFTPSVLVKTKTFFCGIIRFATLIFNWDGLTRAGTRQWPKLSDGTSTYHFCTVYGHCAVN